MNDKVTWKDIYKEFRDGHPNLKKRVTHWQPFDYATIIMRLDDGRKMIYNCSIKRCYFINEDE